MNSIFEHENSVIRLILRAGVKFPRELEIVVIPRDIKS